MKILCITRLFSGIESTLLNQEWAPTGVPTIFKMIETFDKECNLEMIFTSKDGFTKWERSKVTKLSIDGLKHRVTVLPGSKILPNRIPRKIKTVTRELFHLLFCFNTFLRSKPDLIYVDHANTLSAAFFSRFTNTPVVYRVMGVYPAMRSALKGNRPAHLLLRLCYRSPFRQVICTQDGSGIEPWLKNAINKRTSITSLINGVDLIHMPKGFPEYLESIPLHATKVLFIGKLEQAKGCEEFLDGFIKAYTHSKGNMHAIIVGSGSKRETMISTVKKLKMEENVTFFERLPHKEILKVHNFSDIYVSLNKLGNLSVANLEAMRFGQCIILPKSQPETQIDKITDELIPTNCAIRISSSMDTDDLARQLSILCNDKEKIVKYKENMKNCASKFIPSWKERVETEFEILTNLSKLKQ